MGAGIHGAAAAWALTGRGVAVTLFEQFHPGHRRGSSHGTSRIFRLSYPDETYVRMAMESLPLWRTLERTAGRTLLVTTGGIDVGRDVRDNAAALRRAGARFEVLTAADAVRRFGHVSVDDGEVVWQPEGGWIRADAALRAFLDAAGATGLLDIEAVRVARIRRAGERVEVVSDAGESTAADAVVVTAGAWARDLLRPLDIALDVRTTRETVAYFDGPSDSFAPVVEWGDPTCYALPAPGEGIKAGEHIAGPTADPDDDGTPSDESVARIAEWIEKRLPGVERAPSRTETCLYTNTPDQHFVLERYGRVVVGSACSGHGFKFAPLIGRKLAALCMEAL